MPNEPLMLQAPDMSRYVFVRKPDGNTDLGVPLDIQAAINEAQKFMKQFLDDFGDPFGPFGPALF